MLSVTKACICCAFMEFAGLESMEDTPSNITLPPNSVKTDFLTETVGKFVEKFVMVEFDAEKAWCDMQLQKADDKAKKLATT